MSIASRVNHQFNTSLPKEFLLEVANERNRIALPPVDKGYGIRLPPEKYCLTGVNWDLVEGEDLWGDEEEDDEDGEYEGDGDALEDMDMEGLLGPGFGDEGAGDDEDAQGEDDDMGMDLYGSHSTGAFSVPVAEAGDVGVKDESMTDA